MPTTCDLAAMQLHLEKNKLILTVEGKRKELTYQQAFALGHSLLTSREFHDAESVFKVLARIRGRGPRAKVMLAKCKAELDSFEACEELLCEIFNGENEPVVEVLQAAFVFHTMGLQKQAIQELTKIVNEHPDLPSACLFLGDLFDEAGKPDKASYCWKLAIERDRGGGGVAKAARKQLDRVAKQTNKATKKDPENPKKKKPE